MTKPEKGSLQTPGSFIIPPARLSSLLDNAPTYVTFFETEIGKLDKKQIAFVTQLARIPIKSTPTVRYEHFFKRKSPGLFHQGLREEPRCHR